MRRDFQPHVLRMAFWRLESALGQDGWVKFKFDRKAGFETAWKKKHGDWVICEEYVGDNSAVYLACWVHGALENKVEKSSQHCIAQGCESLPTNTSPSPRGS